MITYRMNIVIQPLLFSIVYEEDASKLQTMTDHLTAYMDAQLIVMSDGLGQRLFKKMMYSVWKTLLKELENLLLPSPEMKKGPSEAHTKLIAERVEHITEILKDFFHADGSGLSAAFLEKSIQGVYSIAHLYTLSLEDLLSYYQVLKTKEAAQTTPTSKDVSNSVITSYVIFSIMCTLKTNKDIKKTVDAYKKTH